MRTLFRIIFGLLGWISEKTEPMEGISLSGDDFWIVGAPKEPVDYFRALIGLVSEDCVVCFEGSTDSNFWSLAESKQVPNPTKVAAGTIWPKSDFCHVRATRQNLEELAEAVEQWRIAVPAIHTYVYRGDSMILEWHDAFCDDPILVSNEIDESLVREFADALEAEYSRNNESR